ncbi:MAG: ROK family protein [Clostridia bacterium]|nr:ROK family protein [Clostridia bacterium]
MKYYLGIDLGGTNIAVGVVNEDLEIVVKGSVPTGADREADAIIADMAELCKKVVADAGLTMADIDYAGIASPGTANSDNGVIEYANNLPFVNYPLAQKLSDMAGVKTVYIANDANAAALAEALAGAAKGAKNSVMITLGTGVGGGIILDGKVYCGFNHAGAELGHMIIQQDGVPCSCTRIGCWEAYSSATGLIRMTKEKLEACKETGSAAIMEEVVKDAGKVSGKTSFVAMRKGCKAGAEVVDEYISYLACGLANIITIFHPDILSIGGGICNEGDALLVPLQEKIWAQLSDIAVEDRTKIVIAQLGNDAGIIGGAALGRQYQ